MGQGYNAHSDILTRTKDGRDLNELWVEYQAVIADFNAQRQTLVDFLTYPVLNPIEEVPVVGTGSDFEEASEYGEPKGIRPGLTTFSMGFPFKWYDLASRFTWQLLADATVEQIDAVQNAALEADSRLVFNQVMKRLFDPANTTANINKNPYNVYAFYNADGTVPPPYRTNTFLSTHTHYTTTSTLGGAEAVLDAEDLDALIRNVTEHGYTKPNGYDLVVMVNRTESTRIRAFRSAASNNGTADATHGDWDFIPAQSTAASLLPQNAVLLGSQPSNTYKGMSVIGSYGDALIIEEDYVPAGYLAAFATGGPQNVQNPIGFRQHANPALQGMRLVKGPTPDYPLIDSFYVRGFGLGVRHRGAAAFMQVTTSATYTAPTNFG